MMFILSASFTFTVTSLACGRSVTSRATAVIAEHSSALIVMIGRALDTLAYAPKVVVTAQLLSSQRDFWTTEEVPMLIYIDLTCIFPAKIFFALSNAFCASQRGSNSFIRFCRPKSRVSFTPASSVNSFRKYYSLNFLLINITT